MKNTRYFRHCLFLFLLISPVFHLSAQLPFYERIFGTTGSDQAFSVKQLSDGTIYLAGSSDALSPGSFDATLSKLDYYGNPVWTKYYNGGQNDFAFHLVVLPDQSLVLAGSRQSAAGFYDALAIHTDTAGNILDETTFGLPLQDESFAHISEDGTGKLIACGYTTNASEGNNVYVVKMDLSCNLIWEDQYGGMQEDYGQKIIPAADSGYVFVADSRSFGSGTYDIWLSKIDTSGALVWNYVSADTVESGSQGVISTQDGHYVIFGETETATGTPFNFSIEKVLNSGSGSWKKNFGDLSYNDALFEIIEMPEKDFICTGYSNSFNHGAALDLVVLRVDSAGTVEWAQSYGGNEIDIGYDMISSQNGGFLITGKTSVLSDDEYYLLSLDTLGLLSSLPEAGRPEEPFGIYPNPSDGRFTLKGGAERGILNIRVYSLLGQQLAHEQMSYEGHPVRLDLRDRLPGGCYMLRIEKEGHSGSLLMIIR